MKTLPCFAFAVALVGCQSLEFPSEESFGGTDGDGGPGTGGGNQQSAGTTSTGTGASSGGGVEATALPGDGVPGFLGLFPTDECVSNAPDLAFRQAPAKVGRSFASAQFAKASVAAGFLPAPESVRVEDFLAYWAEHAPVAAGTVVASFDAPQGSTEGTLEVRAFMGPLPTAKSGGRDPVHFVVLADVSSSMAAVTELEAHALDALGTTLEASGDSASLVTYGGDVRVLLEAGSGSDLKNAIGDNLEPRGGGDLIPALEEAKGLRLDGFDNQVLIFTDGGIPVSPELTAFVAGLRGEGTRTSVVQLGKSGRVTAPVLHGAALDAIADAGDGTALYVADAVEADGALGPRMQELFYAATPNAALTVTLPNGFTSLEAAAGTGDVSGARVGYGRTYAFRHRMSVCQSVSTFASDNPDPAPIVQLALVDQSDADAVLAEASIPFDASFLAPSLHGRLEGAVAEAAAFFRTRDASHFDAARCVLGTLSNNTKGCGEPGTLCTVAADLADVLDHAADLAGVTSACVK